MRLTVKTNLAMRTLMFCAVNKDRLVRKQDIAQRCNASEAHLSLVINKLAQTGFLETVRGRHGGIRLRGEPTDISVGKVFRLFEAGVPFTECFDDSNNQCPISATCRLGGVMGQALAAFYSELDGVTLEDLVKGNTGLYAILGMDGAAIEPAAAST